LGMDLLRTGLTLGILKGAAFAGRQGIMRSLRMNEALPATWTQSQQSALAWGANASAYLGLVGSHWFQEKTKLIPFNPRGNLWLDALGTHLALGIGSRAGRKVFGRHLTQLEQQLALKANALYQPPANSRTWLEAFKKVFSLPDGNGLPPGMMPAAAGIGGGFLSTLPVEVTSKGPSRDHIFQAKAHRESGGRVDPKKSLGVLPAGSLTPHGDEISTHQRAVGDKRWVGRVAAYNGHLKYKGQGRYEVVKADEAKGLREGQILNEDEAATYFADIVKGETGFRKLASDLPIETDWAGQIPTGFRGEEGKTEEALLKLMGLTKRQIKGYSFNSSGTLITRADQFALQGLFALYRSAVQWGVRLEEIVGNDPRQMAVAVSAGLGGMNNLVDLITASTQRRLKDGVPTTKTVPTTTPMMLPSLLIDSMQGLFVAILGPKGDSYPVTLARNSIIQTVGRIPVNVGACATGYKTFGDAADMFRPNWPGQLPTELAFFGSSEASFGRINARTTATGFNAMGAMETRERLEGRGGRLEDGYAPLTQDVKGFWPTEGAGAGALMRIHRQVELGLPIQARLLGYSIMGDQGGKPNPAGLGLGGLTTLLESLNMMVEWQRTPVEQLRFMSLHGTGTPDNNRVEPTNLLKALEAFAFEGQVKLSAFKAFLGHGLGAAGSME
ncbi:MAG: hypothetical protein R3257_06325, partial [bacterium]|nr:hypothetical protein [bacterium]